MKLLGEEFHDRQYKINDVANAISYHFKGLTPEEAEIVLNFVLARVRAEQMKQFQAANAPKYFIEKPPEGSRVLGMEEVKP